MSTGTRAATDELELLTADGVTLRGRWRRSPAASQAGAVLLVHGFAASQDDHGVCELANALHATGCDVLTYDARGHGRSDGWSAVGATEHLDVASAVECALETGLPIVIVGVSMGAIAVVNYLAHLTAVSPLIAGAVLVSAPARWRMRPSAVGILTAALTRTWVGRWVAARHLHVRIAPRWNTGNPLEALVGRMGVPLAIVHGQRDRLLDLDHGRRLHRSAGEPRRLFSVEGMGHGVDNLGVGAALEAVKWAFAHG